MEMIYLLFIAFLLAILMGICLFVFLRVVKEKESEFVVNYNVLTNVIELYKETILSNKINLLRSKYDLNEKSATNSRQSFEKAKNELIANVVKEIIKDYLSKECLKSLLGHYSIDGLSLLIITHLKR